VKDEGPLLETLTHRLAECPGEFLLEPGEGDAIAGEIDVIAIVSDHLRALGDARPENDVTPALSSRSVNANLLRLIAIVTWMLHDDWFLKRPDLATAQRELLLEKLAPTAAVVDAKTIVTDPDRREELARVCLKHLGLRPKGETIAQATDRLTTLDSAERVRVVKETRRAEERARKVREMMAKRAAEEAAAKVSRE
jgi:hypothetical protein